MSTTEKSRPIPIKIRLLDILRTFFDVVTSVFFKYVYGGPGKKIPPIEDDFLKQPAIEVARRIRLQEISSVEVLQGCIKRIKDINSELNCVVENRFEVALKEAKEADDLIRSGTKTVDQLQKEKPFLGVPFTTKDSIFVKGLRNTAGLVSRRDFIADRDADAIKLLRDSGAIIIAITNVPELCMWWETHNHIYGRTNNPYNTNHIVGGSSGGEGCLQAAGGSCFGIGSDIGGSIRMPAYFNGIFGHKPSRSVVSNSGQFPLPESELINSFLCIGPMTRYATDLKPILKVISGENQKKLNLEQSVDISKLKIFYQINSNAPLTQKVDRDIVTAMNKVVEYFYVKRKLVAEEKKIEYFKKSMPIWFSTLKSENPFGNYLMKDCNTFKVIFEIIKNLLGLSENTFITLCTALVDMEKADFECEKYKHYLKERDNFENIFKEMLGDDGVFLYPTHPTPAPFHNQPMMKPMNFIYTAIINSLGLPATTVPLGLSRDGLPIGIQVISNYNNDRLCLAVAEELERAFGGWIEPQNDKQC